MPLIPQQDTAAEAARRIRQIVMRVGREATGACRQIRQLVQKFGRTEILTALGDDAADLRDFYDDISALSLKYIGETIDPIPADPAPEPELEP